MARGARALPLRPKKLYIFSVSSVKKVIFVCATRVLKLLLSGRAGEAVPWKRAYVRFIFHTLLATIYENLFSGPPLRKSWVRPCMLPMECWNPFTRAPSAVSGLGLCILHHHIPDVPTPVVGYRGAWILFFAHGTYVAWAKKKIKHLTHA